MRRRIYASMVFTGYYPAYGSDFIGVNENARTENAAPSKMKGWQTRDRNAMERRKCINEQNCEANNKHALA